jgi:hypothetical protein
MTSRIILSQLKRAATLRTASLVPQVSNYTIKRTLMTKNLLWANRMNTHKVTSLLGSQQGKKESINTSF